MANYDGVPADENNSEDGTSSKAPFDYKKWANFRLSETCLGDLFRRLDIDGNGVLELIEFVNIVKKLKLDCPPSLLAEIFARADADGNGHMTLDEFIMAYNLLYDSIPLLAAPAVTDDGDSPEKCFIWAVRYGYDALLEEFCYDVFKGGLDCMYEKISHFEDGTARVYDLKRGGNIPLKPTAKGAGRDCLKTNSFDFLADVMRRDAGENRDHGGNVMWWVDVSYKQHVTSELIRAFKLDKNLEPKMYIHQLEETSARIVPGNLDNTNNADGGEERMGGSSTATKSLMFQLQAQWIENLPVMNIVSEISASWPTFIQNIVKYFGVRLPLLQTLAFAHHRRRERAAPPHIDVAKLISDETMGIDNPCVGTSGDGPDVKKRGSLDYNANEANSKARPSDRYVLLGESVLKQHPADFKTDLLTMHAVDFGGGSHTMISYHRWFEGESAVSAAPPSTSSTDLAVLSVAFDGDDDAAAKAAKAKEEANRARYACAGAMGRILQAVRAQLRYVIIRKGVTGENSELADSTGALMALIIEKLHIFNEKCLDNTEEWLDCVKYDLHDNFAGRKHLMHLHEIKLILLKMHVITLDTL